MSSRDLVSSEGVDEASAKGTSEGLPSPAASGQGDAGPDPDVSQEVSGDVLGEAPRGAPVDEAQAAGPVDMETAQSRQARDEAGPGQQLQAGEG